MNKSCLNILLCFITVIIAGCQKSEMQVLRSLPSEAKFTSIDLTGARSLAVMQTMDGNVVTRSHGGGTDYRLCVLDEDGQAEIASISLKTAGNESNKAWQKIKRSLTLVPSGIVPISKDYLHLDDVMAVHDENLSEITNGAAEYTAINGYLQKLGGGYILRLSDGALFKSPIPSISTGECHYKRFVQVTPDGKTFVAINPNMGLDLENPLYFPVVISDQGSVMKVTSSPSDILGMFTESAMVWAPENQRFVIFNDFNAKTGAWSFDMNLQPLFLDYSVNLAPLIDNSDAFMFTYKNGCYVVEPRYSDVYTIDLYEVRINGNEMDCSLALSSTCDQDFKASFHDYGALSIEAENGILFIDGGSSIYIDFNEPSSIIVRKFPGEFYEFDLNGRSYKPGIDTIEAYDAFTDTRTVIPVQWDKTSVGRLVTAELNNMSGDYYSVKGRTRDAVEVIALIEKSTGLVTITNLTEFGSAIITTSYRLN